MKRFIVFAGPAYYPAGGSGDLVSDHETLKEAMEAAQDELNRQDWIEVFDQKDKVVVHSHYG